jgi:hypothetical protein
VLFGGSLFLSSNAPVTVLAQLTPQGWDAKFFTNEVVPGYSGTFATSVSVQTNGHFVVCGSFITVGGYWRQNIVGLDARGKVDPCFDPGLGLSSGSYWARTVAPQPDGRLLVGGYFNRADTIGQANITRLLPSGDCNAIHVYRDNPQAGTFYPVGIAPPGGTNYLQYSTNLMDWIDLDVSTGPLVRYPVNFMDSFPQAFFRVKKVF